MKSKTKSMRFFAVFLVITLMLTSMPLSIFAVESTSIEDSNVAVASGETEFGIIPKDELEETIVLSEVISRREENVKHFDIGNGMYQAVTYGTAVHRKDANGMVYGRILITDYCLILKTISIQHRMDAPKQPCLSIRMIR